MSGRIGSCVIAADRRGATVRLAREEWGTVIDALIEHERSSSLRAEAARRAGDSVSTSDLRAETCRALIRMIGGSLA